MIIGNRSIINSKEINIWGTGLYALTLAQALNGFDFKINIYEIDKEIGGTLHSTITSDGVEIPTYGYKIFHTRNEEVLDFLSKFTSLERWNDIVLAEVDGKLVHMPISYLTLAEYYGTANISEIKDSINTNSPIDYPPHLKRVIREVGFDLFNKLIKTYSENQWLMPITEIPAFVFKRIAIRNNFNPNYHDRDLTFMPSNGYHGLIKNLSKNLNIKLGVPKFEYEDDKLNIWCNPIDDICDDVGKLPYITHTWDRKVIQNDGSPITRYPVINTGMSPYLRMINHNLGMVNSHRPKTKNLYISYEYSHRWEPGLKKLYPINTPENNRKYQEIYKKLMDRFPNLLIGSRLGSYSYDDMDETVDKALKLAIEIVDQMY